MKGGRYLVTPVSERRVIGGRPLTGGAAEAVVLSGGGVAVIVHQRQRRRRRRDGWSRLEITDLLALVNIRRRTSYPSRLDLEALLPHHQ